MRKLIYPLSFGIAVVIFFGFELQDQKFYYAFNEKIPLTEVNDKLTIKCPSGITREDFITTLKGIHPNAVLSWFDQSTAIIDAGSKEKRDKIIDNLLKLTETIYCYSMYKTGNGFARGVTNEFLVKFKPHIAREKQIEINNQYGVNVVKTTDTYQLLIAPKQYDILEIANKYQESGLVEFSQPNFITQYELCQQTIPNDTYFSNQFFLHNTGQVFNDGHSGTPDADIDAPECWPMTLGSGNVIVAVLDVGITSNHPDLPDTRQLRLNNANTTTSIGADPNNVSPGRNLNHGNAMAGVIAATQNNSEGVSGICPNCKVMPVKVFNENNISNSTSIIDGINFARSNGASIIVGAFVSDSDNPNNEPAMVTAISTATTQGRNNLGCVVVLAAGNNGGFVHFPSNVNVSGVLTVGASDRNDSKSIYSPTGNPSSPNNQIIDLTAPSHKAYPSQIPTETFETWTIDIINQPNYDKGWGWNPWPEDYYHPGQPEIISPPSILEQLPGSGTNFLGYTGRFGGTSHATAVVSGVAALILSANPTLTQQQVFNVITSKTDKVGGYIYTGGTSNELGSGRVNACQAVLEAFRIGNSIIGPNIVCASANFSLQNIPNIINWTSSNSSGLTINQTTGAASRQNNFNGQVTVTATISTACGSVNFTKNVMVGNYLPAGISSYQSNCSGNTFNVLNTNLSSACTANTPINFSYQITDANYSNFVFTPVSVPSGASWSFSGGNLYMTVTTPSSRGSRSETIALSATGPCGNYNVNFTSTAVNYSSFFAISPNPSKGSVTVSMDNENSLDNDSQSLIYAIKITDHVGTPRGSFEYKGVTSVNISLQDLNSGTYLLSVFDGKTWSSKQLMVQK